MLRFLKKEEVIAKGPIFPIKLKADEEKKPKICDVAVHFPQVDSSTQALIIGRVSQAGLDIQKKVALTIYLLRNVIEKVVVDDGSEAPEVFERASEDEEKTLRYLSEQIDTSHNSSVAVFFGISQLVLDNIIIPQDVKKKSGQQDLPIEKGSNAGGAQEAKEDGQQGSAKE